MPFNLEIRRIASWAILFAFWANSFIGPDMLYAQDLRLPAPGAMVRLSPDFKPPVLKGIKVHPDNPFRLDFILDKGDGVLTRDELRDESTTLIKYFLASLTIPEKNLWVNLSPYEKGRIIPPSFGMTEMGRDLLAEDYMLKQVTASLIYPEDAVGKRFWKRVYQQAAQRFGTTQIPVNTFNKVWIMPEKAVVYENAKAGTAYVVSSRLKVMLEQDYLALYKNNVGVGSKPTQERAGYEPAPTNIDQLGFQIVREIVIPELTKEVNEDKNFAPLRQVFHSLILATWYKRKIKDSILALAYENRNKINGTEYKQSLWPYRKGENALDDTGLIYQRYLQAFKKGAYNYIKEEIDPATQQNIPRKYFSGGVVGAFGDTAMAVNQDAAQVPVDATDVEIDADFRPLTFSRRAGIATGAAWITGLKSRRANSAESSQDGAGAMLFKDQDERLAFTDGKSGDFNSLSTLNLTGNDISATFKPRREVKDFLNVRYDKEKKKYDFILPEDLTVAEGWALVEKIRNLPLPNKETLYEKFKENMAPVDVTNLTMEDVKRELNALLFWRGVQVFSTMVKINLEDIRQVAAQRLGGATTVNGKIWIIDTVLDIIHRNFPEGAPLDNILGSAPNTAYNFNRPNCVMRSAVTAYFLEKLGIPTMMVDILTHVGSLFSPSHLLLIAPLSEGDYYLTDPLKERARSHRVSNLPKGLNEQTKMQDGTFLDINNDDFISRLRLVDWHRGFYASYCANLGSAWYDKNNMPFALEKYKEAITASSSFTAALESVGAVYLNSPTEVLGIDSRETQRLARAYFEKVTELDPKNLGAQIALSNMTGDDEDSFRRANIVIGLSEDLHRDPRYIREEIKRKIKRELKIQRIDDDIEREREKEKKTVAAAYYIRAYHLENNGNYRDAVSNYTRSMKIYLPSLKSANSIKQLGEILLDKNEVPEIKMEIEEMIHLAQWRLDHDKAQASKNNTFLSQGQEINDLGGIDFSSTRELTLQNEAQAIKFHIDPAMLGQFKNAVGLRLVITGLHSSDVRTFLGIAPAK